MKNLNALILLFSLQAQATNYYFSISGSDANAGTINAPFKSLSKAGSVGTTGDSVLFKAGEVWYGTLNCRSGVNYSSYGGGKAIIEGFQTLQGFTQSGNLYSMTLSTQTYMVIVDGVFKPYGRSPKSGYYNCTSAGTNTITGNFSGNYVGGEVVWRPFHWVLSRGMVSAQSGSTVTYQPLPAPSGGVYPAVVNYGFFFQNNPSLNTSLGEWSCVGTKFSIWLDQPRTVRAAIIENIINLNGLSNVSITNLTIQGANGNAIYMPNAKNIKIDNVNVFLCGKNFIYANAASGNSVTNSNFDRCNSNGIVANSSNWTITGNNFSNMGFVAGMGASGEGQYWGIINVKSPATISNNTFRNLGYNGITPQGGFVTIKNNYIDSFCTVKDDGGAIYFGALDYGNSLISGNVITNGIGAPDGTPDKTDPRAHAIYADDGAHNAEISFNTIQNSSSGLYSHNGHELNIHDNLIVDCKITGIKYYNDANTIANIKLLNNTFYNTKGGTLSRATGGSNSPKNFFSAADFNYWTDGNVFMSNSGSTNLAGWKSQIGKEASSKTVTASTTTQFKYNPTSTAQTFPLTGNYQDLKGTIYAGQVTLPPYSGILLFPTSVQPPPTFFNQAISQSMSTTCTNGSGISATYSVPANKYSSNVSQADANAKALNEVNSWWQNMVNNCGCKTQN